MFLRNRTDDGFFNLDGEYYDDGAKYDPDDDDNLPLPDLENPNALDYDSDHGFFEEEP